MAVTLRREPQLLQVMKYKRFSPLLSSVSGDLQVLQVTYSTGKQLVSMTLFYQGERKRKEWMENGRVGDGDRS